MTDHGSDSARLGGLAANEARLPLEGLRVLEMGVLVAGPFCGQLLADFGAEVIKIEDPGSGDPMRHWGQEKPHGHSLWFPVIARNKKSVTCNLRTEEGRALVRRMVTHADVIVENFRPGTLERWGLGYDELAAINPGIVLIRVSGFGQTGPYAARPGYGSIGEAMGGLRYVVGDPSTPPSRMGISIGDSLAGIFAALGGMVALRERDRSGRGQVVDTAIYEAVLGVMESLIPEYTVGGFVRERSGPILPNIAPSNVYPTADDKMVLIAANQDTVFRRLTQAMAQPELADNPRYASHAERGRNQRELDDLIAKWTSSCSSAALLSLLEEMDVPHGLIFRAPEMVEDPHFAARGAIVDVPDPTFGKLAMQAVFPRLTRTPGEVRHTGPSLGEHNGEVYEGLLGLTGGELKSLRSQGVV